MSSDLLAVEPRAESTVTQDLTRHFLRQFFENDMVSSTTDLREAFSLLCTALISCSLFVTIFLSLKYLDPIMSPGLIAVASLDDKAMLLAYPMTIMALLAIAEWDALALDARDAVILGALPVPTWRLVLAKIRATLVFAGIVLLVLNIVPSVVFPILVVARMPVDVVAVLRLIASHALSALAAGACGFLAVVALREIVRACLSPAWFKRVSLPLRGLLVIPITTAFLLVPVLSSDIARARLDVSASSPYVAPPLWFVGTYEAAAGQVVAGLSRANVPRRVVSMDREATALYESRRPLFGTLAVTGLEALALLSAIALVAYAWNSRRLPLPPIARRAIGHSDEPSRIVRVARKVAGPPVSQAGFFLTCQTLVRSERHRMWLAISLAAGLALTAITLRSVELQALVQTSPEPSASLFAIQTILLLALLVGFRQALRLPADMRALWAFYLSWSGDDRTYLAGVKRAAFTVLVLPLIVLLVPWHVVVFGVQTAAVHAACGLLAGVLMLELMWLGVDRPPFGSSYVPPSNLRIKAPLYVVLGLSLIYGFAAIERSAILGARGTWLIAVLAFLASVTWLWDRRLRRRTSPFAFEELPEAATPQLSLNE